MNLNNILKYIKREQNYTIDESLDILEQSINEGWSLPVSMRRANLSYNSKAHGNIKDNERFCVILKAYKTSRNVRR